MVKFKELGFKSFKDYKEYFLNTLLCSNKTYEYFVDWNKVRVAVRSYLEEISLLNSLSRSGVSDRVDRLSSLLEKYPKVVEVLPLLIAERARNGRIDIFDPEVESFLSFEFKSYRVNKRTIPQIVSFCVKTGIIGLFGEINDLYDYLLGVEVGLDSNARKNRSGSIFENMCLNKVKKLIRKPYRVVNNDSNFSLYPKIASGKSKGKTHDIVVYKDEKPVLIGECNFYNTTGSKPVSIAESYIEMHRVAKEHGVEFVWITDGPAWRKMEQPLLLSMKKLDWVLNYKMIGLINRILA